MKNAVPSYRKVESGYRGLILMEKQESRFEFLEREGWTRQFIANEPRLSEARNDYEELGFEVLLEPLDPCPQDPSCTTCLLEDSDLIKVIYTRPKENTS